MTLSIRSYTPQDVEALAELIKQTAQADNQKMVISPGRLRQLWGQPNLLPEDDFFLAESDGAVVGYLTLTRELPVGRVILEGAVHPAHRGQGIGAVLFSEGLAHGKKLGAPVAHMAVAESWGERRRLLEREGFHVVRRYWRMRLEAVAPVIDVSVPDGMHVRMFHPGDEESLTTIQNRAFTGSWGFCPNTVAEVSYRLEMSVYRPGGVIFLCQGEAVLGYCWTRIDEEENRLTGDPKGYVYMVGVDPSLRGRGLGRVMVMAGVAHIRKIVAGAVELEVDSENVPAMALYKSLGFQRKGVVLWYERHLKER